MWKIDSDITKCLSKLRTNKNLQSRKKNKQTLNNRSHQPAGEKQI